MKIVVLIKELEYNPYHNLILTLNMKNRTKRLVAIDG